MCTFLCYHYEQIPLSSRLKWISCTSTCRCFFMIHSHSSPYFFRYIQIINSPQDPNFSPKHPQISLLLHPRIMNYFMVHLWYFLQQALKTMKHRLSPSLINFLSNFSCPLSYANKPGKQTLCTHTFCCLHTLVAISVSFLILMVTHTVRIFTVPFKYNTLVCTRETFIFLNTLQFLIYGFNTLKD